MNTILYLHGFLSSPQSEKAQQTLAFANQYYPDVQIITPQIPNTIDNAVGYLRDIVEEHFRQKQKPLLCIGSSMGGFLSTWLLSEYPEDLGGKAVLINPAVAPYNLMQGYLGEHTNPYSNEKFRVDAHHIDVLRSLDPSSICHPERFQVLLQTGDEVLDYRLAEERYHGAEVKIEQGGDHSFINYGKHLADIFDFLSDSARIA